MLLLVVELCSLTFRFGDQSKSNIVAAALFGDGAAGMLINGAGDGPILGDSGEHTWPDLAGRDGLAGRGGRVGRAVLARYPVPGAARVPAQRSMPSSPAGSCAGRTSPASSAIPAAPR
mgnify:CR=1 FL=1